MSKQRSLIVFENCIKSEATKRVYLQNTGYFRDFYKLKDFDSILKIENEKLQIMAEDYVMHLKGKVSPN